MPWLQADASLAGMHIQNRRCDDLFEKTAAILNDNNVASMHLAVQRRNLEVSVKSALNQGVFHLNGRCQQQSQLHWSGIHHRMDSSTSTTESPRAYGSRFSFDHISITSSVDPRLSVVSEPTVDDIIRSVHQSETESFLLT